MGGAKVGKQHEDCKNLQAFFKDYLNICVGFISWQWDYICRTEQKNF